MSRLSPLFNELKELKGISPNGYTRLIDLHDNEVTRLVKDNKALETITHDGNKYSIYLIDKWWIIADLKRGFYGGGGSSIDRFKTVEDNKIIKVNTGISLKELIDRIDSNSGRLFNQFNDLVSTAKQPQTIDFIISRDFIAELKKAQKQIENKKVLETQYKDGVVTVWSDELNPSAEHNSMPHLLISYKTEHKLPKNIQLPYIKGAIDEVVVRTDGSMWLKSDNIGLVTLVTQEPKIPYQDVKFSTSIDLSPVTKELKSLLLTADKYNPKKELNGILIDVKDNEGTLVSTDTRRLATIEKKIKFNAPDNQYIIPYFALSPKVKKIELSVSNMTIRVIDGEYTKITDLTFGVYPDYQRVIPSEDSTRVSFSINTKSFNDATKSMKANDVLRFEINENTGKIFNHKTDKELGKIVVNSERFLKIKMVVAYKYIKEAMVEKDNIFKINKGTLPFTVISGKLRTAIMPIIEESTDFDSISFKESKEYQHIKKLADELNVRVTPTKATIQIHQYNREKDFSPEKLLFEGNFTDATLWLQRKVTDKYRELITFDSINLSNLKDQEVIEPKVKLKGQTISIENIAGSERTGIDTDGKRWTSKMVDHYGYFNGTLGNDGDEVDVFVNHEASEKEVNARDVFAIVQNDIVTQKFDEHKVVLGATSRTHAKEIYLRNYSKDFKGFGRVLKIKVLESWLN